MNESQEKSVIELPAAAIERWQPRAPEVVMTQPLGMLATAVSRGMDVATIQGLMDLQQRHERADAERAYNVAFAAFKAEAVTILKNKAVTAGPLAGKSYAELHSVVNAVTPALSKHGLSTSWKITKDEKDWLEVTCFLKHSAGHSESVSMGGPPDVGGAKSAIQARASTVTYLERYTLKAICGVSEQGDDHDGGRGAKGMPEAELQGWVKKIEATTTKDGAKTVCAEGITAANGYNDLSAYNALKGAHKAHVEFIGKAQ